MRDLLQSEFVVRLISGVIYFAYMVVGIQCRAPVLTFLPLFVILAHEITNALHFSVANKNDSDLIVTAVGYIYVCLSAWRTLVYSGLAMEYFLLVCVCDTCAYMIGSYVGGYKPFAYLSPNKTVSGYIGGLISVCIASRVLAALGFRAVDLWVCIAIWLTASVGDLSVSFLKRIKNIKTWSGIMPGHGGLVDRLDGFLPVGIVACIVSRFQGIL